MRCFHRVFLFSVCCALVFGLCCTVGATVVYADDDAFNNGETLPDVPGSDSSTLPTSPPDKPSVPLSGNQSFDFSSLPPISVQGVDGSPIEAHLSEDSINAIRSAFESAVSRLPLHPVTPPSLPSEKIEEDYSTYSFSSDDRAISGLSGGYYMVVDCALGRNIKFWIPSDFASGSIALDGSNPVNMTDRTIYLMPDDSRFSDYTFSSGRFQSFRYRPPRGDYSSLNITAIHDSNISFLQHESKAVSSSDYFRLLIVVVMIIALVVILGRFRLI